MGNIKFFKIIIVVLLSINIATLAFMWYSNGRHGRNPRHQDIGAFLSEELHFSEAQQNQFDILKHDHQDKVKDLRDKNRAFHDHFFDMLAKNVSDSIQLNNALDSIVTTQKQIEMVTFYHFKAVRAICTSAQQKKFDEVIDDALRMMSPGQQDPPKGPPHGPPPF